MKHGKGLLGRKIYDTLIPDGIFRWLLLTLLLPLVWAPAGVSQEPLKIPLYIKQTEIRVEVAKTPEQRAVGLMNRDHLGKNEGMLFIFETEDFHSFWMKDTRIPLSIAFIDKDGKIVRIADMKPFTLDSHPPPKPILYALEMNKGWFLAHGINVGDTMRFSK